jgi:hypothetical protein
MRSYLHADGVPPEFEGDLVNAPFTFFRIVGERSSEEGLHPTVDRVVLARSALLDARP